MMPVITNTAIYTSATPLVSTAVPGSAIARVPYDNVAPSVSNAQIENNARGNSGGAVAEAEAAAASAPQENISASLPASSQSLNASAQAAFVAQLAAQDMSPEGQTALAEYEKMVVYSDVKYKPSNATKPAPMPSGVFGRIMQEERVAPRVTVQAPVVVSVPHAEVAAQAAVVRSVEVPLPKPQPTAAERKTVSTSVQATTQVLAPPVAVPAHVIQAYASTARRSDNPVGNIEDSV